MFLPYKRHSLGFTLIELLMVVSVITIITGMAIPSFSAYLKNQNLKSAQEQFKNDLRSAQNKSLTGSLSDQTVSYGIYSGKVKYWVVKWFSNTYRVYAMFDFLDPSVVVWNYGTACNNLADASGGFSNASFSLPSGVTFSTSTGCLFFKMSDGSIHDSGGNTSGIINLIQGSTTSRISWNYAGMIGN